jgi:hypothetical protein
VLSVGEEAGVKLSPLLGKGVAGARGGWSTGVAGLKTALICPFVQGSFPFPHLPNGQRTTPVLPEINPGHKITSSGHRYVPTD